MTFGLMNQIDRSLKAQYCHGHVDSLLLRGRRRDREERFSPNDYSVLQGTSDSSHDTDIWAQKVVFFKIVARLEE
jgi:hypothetical protein